MCLDYVDEVTKKPPKMRGYKAFRKLGADRVESVCRLTGNFKLGEWIEDDMYGIIGRYPYYQTGFHVVTNKREAFTWCHGRDYAVHRVEVDDVVASGTQFNKPCYVCRKMKILEEVKRK